MSGSYRRLSCIRNANFNLSVILYISPHKLIEISICFSITTEKIATEPDELSVDHGILGVTFDFKMTFEKHLRWFPEQLLNDLVS